MTKDRLTCKILNVLLMVKITIVGQMSVYRVRNPGRDISFPIFTRKEIETKRIRKEIKTIISRLNHFLSFLSNILEKKLKQEYWKGNQNKKISRFIDLIYRLFKIMLGSNWLIFFTNGKPGIY